MPVTPLDPAAMAYFTVAEARALQPLNDAVTYPDAAIDAARVGAEEAIEDECGVAFTPRTATETLDGPGTTGLGLRWPKVRTVTSVSVAGTALTAAQLLEVKTTSTGLYWPAYWAAGTANIVVVYTHGFDAPPYLIKRAALLWTKHFLVADGINERATRVEAGDEGMWLAPREPSGIGEVDVAIRNHSFRTGLW